MRVYIRVNEAIAHYNKTKKPKKRMTLTSLGEVVFAADKRLNSKRTIQIYMSCWNAGNHEYKFCTAIHLAIIAKETGFPICDLIHVENE